MFALEGTLGYESLSFPIHYALRAARYKRDGVDMYDT